VSPLVSVIIPSYNHAPYVADAIDSVLAQTVEDLELVIADDGSTDSSLEIARRYEEADPRVTVVTHEDHANRGLGPTITLAFSGTTGKYLLGLPSDDMLYPDTLEREVAFLDAHPEVGYVYGYAHLIDAKGRMIQIQTPRGPEPRLFGRDLTGGGRIVERLVQGNSIAAMTAMFRRECLDQAGEEHPTLVYGDWERQTRAAAHWEVAFIPRALAACRVHGKNTSIGVPREIQLARQLEVTRVLRDRAGSLGGRLGEPRVRAALELQMGFLRFAGGELAGAADLRAAFARDPALAGDARWLADWLWSRPLDELLPSDAPDLVEWFSDTIRPLLEPQAARSMRRDVAAARAEARAIRLARAGRPIGASVAGLTAIAHRPSRRHDHRLLGVILDSIVATPTGRLLRRAKRRVVHLRRVDLT
jgi:glycosyl transferase family 2